MGKCRSSRSRTKLPLHGEPGQLTSTVAIPPMEIAEAELAEQCLRATIRLFVADVSDLFLQYSELVTDGLAAVVRQARERFAADPAVARLGRLRKHERDLVNSCQRFTAELRTAEEAYDAALDCETPGVDCASMGARIEQLRCQLGAARNAADAVAAKVRQAEREARETWVRCLEEARGALSYCFAEAETILAETAEIIVPFVIQALALQHLARHSGEMIAREPMPLIDP